MKMMNGENFNDFHIAGNCGGFLIKFWFLGFIFLNREFVTQYYFFQNNFHKMKIKIVTKEITDSLGLLPVCNNSSLAEQKLYSQLYYS
jgi:hypothetical protein